MKTVNGGEGVVIVSAKRTPLGSFLGCLSPLSATDLGGRAIAALFQPSALTVESIDEVFMGCVLPAGLGQAPARQAALKAGITQSAGCTTINKVCGSGMKALMLANDLIKAGSAEVVIAGGMESMSNAPYLLKRHRSGIRMGHDEVIDHLFYDGLENAEDNVLMGVFAEQCAKEFNFNREQQDAYAIESVHRAVAAINQGVFSEEIVPVEVKNRRATQTISTDEQPAKCRLDKIPKLKPAFVKSDGTVTAANASSIADGAAALMLVAAGTAVERGLHPLARIVAHSSYACAPEHFTTAPIGAIKSLLQKTGWVVSEVDLFEINEAFAVVSMAAIESLGLDMAKVNVNGGACALGHPIGATGARIVVSLIHALRQRGKKRGVAALCIGGGEATAIAIECVSK